MNKKGNTIPKIIHYCWFGGNPIPPDLQKCIDSWEKLEGYTVMRWDESNCSFDENDFVRNTYADKQLGFIGDYYRLKAVYEYGGIYMDTDVKVCKSFDSLLEYPAFFNFIFDCSVGSAIIGAQKGNKVVKDLMDMYDNSVFEAKEGDKPLVWRDGKWHVNGYVVSNYYYTFYFLKNYPQFRLNNKFQNLGDFVIFPKELFEIGTLTNRQYAVHLCAGEWRIQDDASKTIKARIKSAIKKSPFLFDKLQIIVRKRRYRQLKKTIPFYPYYLAQKNNTDLPEL